MDEPRLAPLAELVYLAGQMGAPAGMFISISDLHEGDVDFTRRLIEGGRERG
jgi:hypothetical protein